VRGTNGSVDFALLGHPSSYEHLTEILLHSRPDYGRDRLARYERTLAAMFEWAPSYVSATELVAPLHDGGDLRGILVICPFLPTSVATPAGVARAYRKVVEGCRLAQSRGARLVGLGGFTSIVGGGQGERLGSEVGVAVTSGNSLTAALALEQLEGLLTRVGWRLEGRTVAVVGAGGDIGRACALALAPRVGRIILVGRSEPRLRSVAERLPAGLPVAIRGEVPDALEASVIVAATSAAEPIISESELRPGTILCDISYPSAVRRSDPRRPDVIVLSAGIAELPFGLDIGYLTRLPEPSLVHGCFAETIVLSMAGRDEPFSIGQGRISSERMAEIRALADEAGVRAAPPLSGRERLDEEAIEAFASSSARHESLVV
jgi:predicted amino acid dehydrogenase